MHRLNLEASVHTDVKYYFVNHNKILQGTHFADVIPVLKVGWGRGTYLCLPVCFAVHKCPFWKGVYCKRKEFAPLGSKFFHFTVDPLEEGENTFDRDATPIKASIPLKSIFKLIEHISLHNAKKKKKKKKKKKQKSTICSKIPLVWSYINLICIKSYCFVIFGQIGSKYSVDGPRFNCFLCCLPSRQSFFTLGNQIDSFNV